MKEHTYLNFKIDFKIKNYFNVLHYFNVVNS